MKINIKTTNIDLTDTLSDYVDEKMDQVEKFLEPNDGSVLCEVEIGMTTKHHQSGKIFRAEINLRASGNNFRAVSEKEDLYIAINDAKEDVIESLKSHKNKQRARFRRGAEKIKNILKGFRKDK
jgi:ribosomal subunit interface protein